MATTFKVINGYSYHTNIKLSDGTTAAIRFEPQQHFGGRGDSTYITSNPLIIEAIRELPRFGVQITELTTTKDTPARTTEAKTEVDLVTLLPDPENVLNEETVTSIPKAKAWLQSEFGMTLPFTASKIEVQIEAAKKNVIFINW